MTRTSPRDLLAEINRSISFLLEHGFATDQNAPTLSAKGEIAFDGVLPVSRMLRREPYQELYERCLTERQFTVLLFDGAMIQIMGRFERRSLLQYRYAYIPSPDPVARANDLGLDPDDPFHAATFDPRIRTVPLRFDYDRRPGIASPVVHPISHLTLGQHSGCRLAVSAAVSPAKFVRLILTCFYSNVFLALSQRFPDTPPNRFDQSLHELEAKEIHMLVP